MNTLIKRLLKGQCHEIFCRIGILSKIRGDIRESRCTTGINDTGGKIAASINDTGGKFATGINDTGGKFFHPFH